jgi:hypothetical protein
LLLQGAIATRWLHKDATNLLLLLQFKHFHTHPFEALKFFSLMVFIINSLFQPHGLILFPFMLIINASDVVDVVRLTHL